MADINKTIEQHTAGPQAIGFDYQFYYFMYLSLRLTTGQKIGFEVKDDIHIDTPNGNTILFQAKHSVQKNSEGETQNLTLMDSDLWKTISNWVAIIKSEKDNSNFLKHTYFHLVTNKNEDNNFFITTLYAFKESNNVDDVIAVLSHLKETTESKVLKAYFKNIISLGKRKLKPFFQNLIIETGNDKIIDKIKQRIFEHVKQDVFVDPVYEKLYTNLQEDKFLEIGNRKKFEITFDDFTRKYGKCFQVAYEIKPLPRRNFPIHLPDDLEGQTFIKQLLDIGVISSGSRKITDYTSQMLKALNHFAYWSEEDLLMPTDISEFERESILIWNNEFEAKYRQLERRINSGSTLEELEGEIQLLGCELVDFIRKENLELNTNNLGVEFSNGHFYSLSDKPDIGWHYDWENKYK